MAAHPLPIYKLRRLVPISFRRAVKGAPDPSKPELDDRSFGSEHAAVVGIQQGDTVTVKVLRGRLKSSTPLFATSAAPATAEVAGGAELPGGAEAALKITGLQGGSPSSATIEIRFGSAGGPVIGQLAAWVYKPLKVKLRPFVVKVGSKALADAAATAPPATRAAAEAARDAARVGPTVKPDDIIAELQRIWRPVGIQFTVLAKQDITADLAVAGQVALTTELGPLFAAHYTHPQDAKVLNLFFVRELSGLGGGTLGLGMPSSVIARIAGGYGYTRPGIALADFDGSAAMVNTQFLGNTLAHEIGHFLDLKHPEGRNSDRPPRDLWSRRMLMFPVSPLAKLSDWRDEVGYGDLGTNLHNGALITMKHLTKLTTDAEANTARLVATAMK